MKFLTKSPSSTSASEPAPNDARPASGQPSLAPDRLLRLPEVQKLIPLSRSTLWRAIRKGKFPAPVRISENAVAWRASDIQQWFDTRVENLNDRARP